MAGQGRRGSPFVGILGSGNIKSALGVCPREWSDTTYTSPARSSKVSPFLGGANALRTLFMAIASGLKSVRVAFSSQTRLVVRLLCHVQCRRAPSRIEVRSLRQKITRHRTSKGRSEHTNQTTRRRKGIIVTPYHFCHRRRQLEAVSTIYGGSDGTRRRIWTHTSLRWSTTPPLGCPSSISILLD